jgi:hypothetical protein
MEITGGKVACAVAGVVIGFVAVFYMYPMENAAVTAAQDATTTAVVETTPANTTTIDAVYPLFSTGISWSPKISVSLPPRSNYNPTDQTIVGYQVTSLPTASTEDIGGTVEPLRNYYDQLLVKNGWSIATQFEADGAGGSLWGFTKGNDILIFSYTSTFMNQQPNQPEQCPCTIVFTIIGGTLE